MNIYMYVYFFSPHNGYLLNFYCCLNNIRCIVLSLFVFVCFYVCIFPNAYFLLAVRLLSKQVNK
jgi:hypothetical protein